MHSHTHGHGHAHGGAGSSADVTWRALSWSLALNGGFLVIEAGIGFFTGSLALLSDAAHMVSDVAALVLALGAARLARSPATPERTWGFLRAETMGAFINGLMLLVACGFIFWEAYERLSGGAPAILAWPVLVAGVIGLVINLGSAWWLYQADRGNLNIRGALIHMLADALGSVGAIASALFLMGGIYAADAVVSVFIGGLVLWGTWGLLRDSGRVLLQYAPAGLRSDAVKAALLELEDLAEVHDLHLWSLDGQNAILSAHLVGAPGVAAPGLRTGAEALLQDRFNIRHTTLQVEFGEDCVHRDCPLLNGCAPAAMAPLEPEHNDHDHGHQDDHHDHHEHGHEHH
jgi:cobalt-zinc-cadmium efflux system protein